MTRQYLTRREKSAMLAAQGWKCGCGCGRPVWPGGPVEYDHSRALALGGPQKPDSALSPLCHRTKTRQDVKAIRKADRAGRKHRGEQRRKNRKIQSRGFPPKPEGYQYQWPKRKMGR